MAVPILRRITHPAMISRMRTLLVRQRVRHRVVRHRLGEIAWTSSQKVGLIFDRVPQNAHAKTAE